MIPVLTTPRMTLGPFTLAHFEAFRAFAATDRSRHLGGPSDDPRDAWDSCLIHAGQWQARGYGGFFASDTTSGMPCGRFSIWHPINQDQPELAWTVFAGFEGRGYAAEGARAVRNWAQAAGLGRLVSYIAAANTRSVALARRLGCTYLRPHQYPDGEIVGIWQHPA